MYRFLAIILFAILFCCLLASNVAAVTLENRISANEDDAEERPTDGEVRRYSGGLEMVYHTPGYNQTVGLRFNGLDIPQGAFITNAYIQFETLFVDSEATTLFIEGHDTDDAPQFVSTPYDISSRVRTDARMPWAPPPWTTEGEAGPDQRTSDLSTIIKEIVDRPGWSSGNSLAFIITGDGRRVAKAVDKYPSGAALLHVEYILPGAVWRVKPNGTDPSDCSGGDSWTTAFSTIQKAIDCASAGDEIWVKRGTYTLSSAINVYKPVGI
jgi:hypothetical protein